MPLWAPDPNEWEGSDAFIIGGGTSLRGFDFNLLKGRNTIGCNMAFRLGPEVCGTVFFSDRKWWDAHDDELAQFKGRVVTHCHSILSRSPAWLKHMRRAQTSLERGAILNGGNSGVGATNLALILGAKRVFLLGCDCKLGPSNTSHWHDWRMEVPKSDLYEKFLRGWRIVEKTLPIAFPGRQVINLGPDSTIPYFPKADWKDFLNG